MRAAGAHGRAFIARRHAPPDPFDTDHGVDTGGIVHLADLDISGRTWEYGQHYEAIPPRSFHQMMREVEIPYEEYVFVDFGSGKGRAVLLAAGYPFKRVVGVELSTELHRIAQRNLLAYPRSEIRCGSVELVCQNAAYYPLPREPSVIYLNNPFHREVMAPLVARVERSLKERGRDLVVIYATPLLGDLWAGASGLTTVRADSDYAIYRAVHA